jgi:hypothetical protein
MSVIGYNVFGTSLGAETPTSSEPNIIYKTMGSGSFEGQKRYFVKYSSPKTSVKARGAASLPAAVRDATSGVRSNSNTYRIDSHWEEDDITKFYDDKNNVGPKPQKPAPQEPAPSEKEDEESTPPSLGDGGPPEPSDSTTDGTGATTEESESETNPMVVYGVVALGALGLIAFLRR